MSYPIIDVSKWRQILNHPGKGNREKYWLFDPSNRTLAMFKIPREDRGEHWAEKLCCEFAEVLEFPCAAVQLAKKDGIIGCLSYFFVNVEYGYSHYDGGHFVPDDYDEKKNHGYNWNFIESLLNKIEPKLVEEILFIMVFDALVGEGDRHQDNWGISRHEIEPIIYISPLYDNSASLGRDLSEEHLNKLRTKEKLLRHIFKSKSKVGWEDTRNEYHFSLIRKLSKKFPKTMKFLLYQLKKLTDNKINEIVDLLPEEIINKQHREFVKNYVKTRRDILIRIGDNMEEQLNNLLLVWKDPETRQRYIVGTIKFNHGAYSFQYTNPDLNEAIEKGFKYFPGFEIINRHYEAKELFPVIKRRLPSTSRPDYPLILEKNGLDYGCTDMDILKATRGRLTTDTFEFVEDFNYENKADFKFTFDLAGARHYKIHDLAKSINVGDEVTLNKEPENAFDKYAVKVILAKDDKHIGYVPKYYSRKFTEFLNKEIPYKVIIKEVDFEHELPDEWVKIQLHIISE